MILVTGGVYQGKGALARELAKQQNAAVIEQIDSVVAQLIKTGKDPYSEIQKLADENPEAVFTINELGCGIVPMDAFDREWRETTGRISCMLAKQAQAVYRVTCGLPVRIK